jgi:tetratricopeptide (TPR) repeat protein
MTLPDSLGPYRILRELGRGGMGVVYEGEPEACPGARYAVKLLLAQDARARERFRREGELLCRVDRHPNVVRVHATGEDRGRPYLVLDLVEGETLADVIARGPAPWRAAVALIEPVARALAFVHSQGLVHRDVKPSNILIDRSAGAEPRPRLTDFGIAHAEDFERLTKTGAVVGTGDFLAPELMRGGAEPDGRADVYALGICLYELLAGKRPFTAESLVDLARQVLEGEPPPPSSHVPGVPRALDRVVLRALAARPADRYPDAAALARDLDALLHEKTPPSHLPGSRKRRAIGVAAGLALVGLVAFFGLLRAPVAGADPLAAFEEDLEQARRELEANHADTAFARAGSIARELEAKGDDPERRRDLLARARATEALARARLVKAPPVKPDGTGPDAERATARAWKERGTDDPLSYNLVGDLDGLTRRADRVYDALVEARHAAPEREPPKELARFVAGAAHACFARHEYERGVVLAMRALELDPTLHGARQDAAYALLHAIEPPRTRLALDLAKAILSDPHAERELRLGAWKDVLFATDALGDRPALDALAAEAIREFPDEPLVIEAVLRKEIVDRDPAAVAAAEKLVAFPFDDHDQEVYRRRLHAYALLVCGHRPKEALAVLTSIFGAEPWAEASTEDFVQAGRAKLQLGDRRGAEDALERARKAGSTDPTMAALLHDFGVELGR